jgi:hypothetical protein
MIKILGPPQKEGIYIYLIFYSVFSRGGRVRQAVKRLLPCTKGETRKAS